MIFKKMTALVLSLVLMISLVGCGAAEEKENEEETGSAYPEKPITMIVPYSAGGTTDIAGRQFANALSKELGQSITVVNQGGASGSVGCKTALDAEPDGYTILFTAESLGTQRVMGISEMSYGDFSPVMAVVNDPKVIVVSKNSPYETLEDLIEDMQENPGKVKMSYTGPGGSGHVQGLIYNKLGLEMSMIAYQGGNECLVAVLGDQVDFTNSNLSTVVGFVESGDLRLLGVSANERLPKYPDVPTLTEVMPEAQEYMDVPFTPLSLLVDKDVPEEVTLRLREAASAAVKNEEWIKFTEDNCLLRLYEKYPEISDMENFYKDWESLVSWMLYDSGAAKISPEDFEIPKP